MLYFFQPVVFSSWFAINSEFWPINLLFLGCSLSEFLPVYSLATDQYSPGTEDTYLPLDWVLSFWLSCPPPWKFILLSLVSVLHAALSPQTAAPPFGHQFLTLPYPASFPSMVNQRAPQELTHTCKLVTCLQIYMWKMHFTLKRVWERLL